jgi:hypothetical protein
MSMMVDAYDKMNQQRKDNLMQAAEGFLKTISQMEKVKRY